MEHGVDFFGSQSLTVRVTIKIPFPDQVSFAQRPAICHAELLEADQKETPRYGILCWESKDGLWPDVLVDEAESVDVADRPSELFCKFNASGQSLPCSRYENVAKSVWLVAEFWRSIEHKIKGQRASTAIARHSNHASPLEPRLGTEVCQMRVDSRRKAFWRELEYLSLQC